MLTEWDGEKLRWIRDAGEWTQYNARLAAALRAHVPGGGSLCDLGCGAGLLSMELAGDFDGVHCVDTHALAVEFVRAEARRRGLENLTAERVDALALRGAWDTVLTVLHGRAEELTGPYLALAKRRLIAVINSRSRGQIGPEEFRSVKRTTPQILTAQLEAQGLAYERFSLTLEHGQPLRSREEARRFVRAYSPVPAGTALEEYLDQVLRDTGDAAFPLYLPNAKGLTVFIIQAG